MFGIDLECERLPTNECRQRGASVDSGNVP